MRGATATIVLGISLACISGAGCGGGAGAGATGSGQASVVIGDRTFAVNNVSLTYETGEGSYFRIEGGDAAHPDEDCLPGLGGGLALYGDLPTDVASLADLSGKELPFGFTGDGDDFNLCFVGSEGLLGVEQGTVRFTVTGDPSTVTGRIRRCRAQRGRARDEPGITRASMSQARVIPGSSCTQGAGLRPAPPPAPWPPCAPWLRVQPSL